MFISYLFALLTLARTTTAYSISTRPVVVAGATGYIGRAVVKELVRRGIPTCALIRPQSISSISDITLSYLSGATITPCNPLDFEETEEVIRRIQPASIICCLASRNGLGIFL